MTDIDVRPTRPDEFRAAANTFSRALMFPRPTDEQWAERLPTWDDMASFSAWDGDRCIGHAGYFRFDTVVPGGALVPTAGVTRVGVATTDRRRGVASRLMRALVDSAVAEQRPLASLRASEAVIYERFGYGMANSFTTIRIDVRRARPLRGAAPGGTFRELAPDEVFGTVTGLYERFGLQRPGRITRPPALFARYLEHSVKADQNELVVVHTNADGVDDGYAQYSTKWEDLPDGTSSGKGELVELYAADPEAELALWRYLFDVDLVTTWTAEERPVDDLVQYALHDRRAYRATDVSDEAWVRVIDVEAALAARRFNPVDGAVVIELSDPWVAANNGRWRVSADGAERADDRPADLVAPIEALGAAYLGGTGWWTLAGTGRVRAARPEAVALADALFVSTPGPICGSFF